MVAQASGCELIIKALVTHHNSYEVQQTGWSTVSNLSEKSELCREALGGVGACEKIVGACGPPSFVAAFQRPCPRLSLRRPFRPPLTLPLPSPLSPLPSPQTSWPRSRTTGARSSACKGGAGWP